MKVLNFLLLLMVLLCIGFASENDTLPGNYSLLNVNNWVYWQQSNGLTLTSNEMREGGFFPNSKSKVVYCDGIIWGGYVNDTDPAKPKLRCGGSIYSSSMQPGIFDDPENANYQKIYRYRNDLPNIPETYLTNEAMNYYNIQELDVTPTDRKNIYNNYIENRNTWPTDVGAPYYDRNRNTQWDSDFDEPGIVDSDQLLWYCTNDLDDSTSKSLHGSPSTGIELQTTVWAYRHSSGILANTIFKKHRLINKSGFRIDSMFVGYFIDTDINYWGNDFGGCDSSLNFGYGYNSEKQDEGYETIAPAVGYVLLQGPVVPSTGDNAIFNFENLPNHKNLNMTSMVVKPTGMDWSDPVFGEYEGTIQLYQLLNGYLPTGTGNRVVPFRKHNSQTGKPTKFVCNGNPVTGEGDIDGQFNNMSPGDRRFYMGSGPFTMEPGDVQEVVIAVVAGQGEDNIESVAKLYESVPKLHELYNSLTDWEDPVGQAQKIDFVDRDLGVQEFILGHSYPNPFNSTVNFRFVLYGDMDVELMVYDLQGKIVKNIYNKFSPAGDYEFSWNGKSNSGTQQPAGVYLVTMKSGAKIQTRKIIYLK